MKVHIVNAFLSAYGGSERGAIELYRGIADRCDAMLWSTGAADPLLRGENSVRRIGIGEPEAPSGGTVVIHGNHFPLGEWLDHARPERLILFCNTVMRPDHNYRLIDRLRKVAELEIVYVSRLMRQWVGIPGRVFRSWIDLKGFSPVPRPEDGRFVVGRLSRDDSLKHHLEDPGLYKRLAEEGVDVRIMGGMPLAPAVGNVPRIALLPAGAEPAPQFLHTLDCFVYRTSSQMTEGGGRVVAEAMACGLPVVCHRNGGYAELIDHGRDGFLFSTGDEALEIVLWLARDSAMRRGIGEAARAKMEAMFSDVARDEYLDYFLAPKQPLRVAPARRRVDFAWELGGHTGHVTTMLPIARSLRARGHEVRLLLREAGAAADLEGTAAFERQAAPIWVGPITWEAPRNFGEILTNFGYADPPALRQLIEAWRSRLADSAAVIANVAPAAHIAARTLGIPSFEISQGFHIPPPTMPAPPLRHWEAVSRAELEAADRAVLAAINGTLAAYGVAPLSTIGELFVGRAMLLTYPELDIYPERGPADYFGIPQSGEGSAVPAWPAGRGPRVFAYLYKYYAGLEPLLEQLRRLDAPTLLLCRGIDAVLKEKCAGSAVGVSDEPMSVSRLLPDADVVICHGSHQMTAQALLAGKPLLMLPTQLEQFLIMRRVVRFGAGLGIDPGAPHAEFGAALGELSGNQKYSMKAREFERRYAGHDRDRALGTIVARIESALARGA